MTNMELTEHSSQSQIDEKAAAHITHKNTSDPNCSHLENVTPNNEADEALDSEVKYPVGAMQLSWNMTSQKIQLTRFFSLPDDLSSLHGVHGHGFPVDWKPDSRLFTRLDNTSLT